jgi:hypothetical protein
MDADILRQLCLCPALASVTAAATVGGWDGRLQLTVAVPPAYILRLCLSNCAYRFMRSLSIHMSAMSK